MLLHGRLGLRDLWVCRYVCVCVGGGGGVDVGRQDPCFCVSFSSMMKIRGKEKELE